MPKPVKSRVKAACLAVLDRPDSKPNEILHACDLLLMLMGYGSRNSAGKHERRKKIVSASVAPATPKAQIADAERDNSRQRLDSILADLHAASQTAPSPRH